MMHSPEWSYIKNKIIKRLLWKRSTTEYGGYISSDDFSYYMVYNKKTKCYECTFSLGEEDLEMRLGHIYTQGIYGNGKYYSDWCTIECQDGMKSEYYDVFSGMTIYRK